MKSSWIVVGIVVVSAFLWTAQAKPGEPRKVPTPLPDSMRGKAPGESRDDNGIEMKLVWCPPGKFMMGKPTTKEEGRKIRGNRVEVTLTEGFWLGRTEVTQEQCKK